MGIEYAIRFTVDPRFGHAETSHDKILAAARLDLERLLRGRADVTERDGSLEVRVASSSSTAMSAMPDVAVAIHDDHVYVCDYGGVRAHEILGAITTRLVAHGLVVHVASLE